MKARVAWLAWLCIVACLAAVLSAGSGLQAQPAGRPASFSVHVEPSLARPGETVTVWIDVTLADDWHIYATTTPSGGPIPTDIRLEATGDLRPVGRPIQPPPIRAHDPNFDMTVEYYGEAVRFGVQAELNVDLAPGDIRVKGGITYMLCNAVSCLPPSTHTFDIPLQIGSGPPRSQHITTPPASVPPVQMSQAEPLDGQGSIVDVERAFSQGLSAFLYLSFTMGLLALLTPCIFPMVPITVSFFTKQESQSRRDSVIKSLVYCLGIMFTFTGLGLLLAATLGASGASRFAANPWVNMAIAGIFVAFALSLFGLFEIQLPSGLMTRLSQKQGSGYGAILLMGFTFSLTSFTCTAPFVGTLLVLTSLGTWMWPILGMLAFSAAFALPFFFLSLFPQGLSSLPRSGGWLNAVKVVMGFLELAAALKFLSNVDLVWGWGVLPREAFLAVWVAIFVLCGIYLLGKIRLPHDTPVESVGAIRLLFSLASLAFGIYLFTGLYGASLGELDAFFPPYGSQGTVSAIRSGGESLEWGDDYDAALQEAQAAGKPVFIDFAGYACTNCRWMEANIFPDPAVRGLLERYVRVQLYTDGQGEVYRRNQAFQETRFGTVALPFYAIMSPADVEISRFPGLTRDKQRFLRFLQQGFAGGAQDVSN